MFLNPLSSPFSFNYNASLVFLFKVVVIDFNSKDYAAAYKCYGIGDEH